MNITSIKYSKEFTTPIGTGEWVSIEAQLDNEDPKWGLEKLKQEILTFHKQANPHLYNGTSELHFKEPERIINRAYERVEILINDCRTIEELSQYKGYATNNQDLMPVYMTKAKQLEK